MIFDRQTRERFALQSVTTSAAVNFIVDDFSRHLEIAKASLTPQELEAAELFTNTLRNSVALTMRLAQLIHQQTNQEPEAN